MKVAALAALGVFIVLPANAGQQQRQYASPATTCDNDGHCTTLASAFPAIHKIRPKAPKAAAAVVPQLPQPRPAQIDAQSHEDPQSQQRSQEPQQAEQQSGQSQDQQQMKQEQQPEQAQQTRQAQQSQPPSQQPHALDANGNTAGIIISHKTGARARVGVAYAARFQAYIDDLENNHGARVLFMNGIRPGRCSPASEHPCGKALDVCQRRRGVVDPRCNLPSRVALGHIAGVHGLFEGGRWCNSDYGHAQVGVTAAACGDRGIRFVQRQIGVPPPGGPIVSAASP
ncbi:MAG: hypothetical protein WAL09_03090 [Pseudolabrys sp.]